MAYIQKVKRKQDTAYRVFILVDKEKRITKTFSTKRSAVQFVNSVESDRNKLLAYTQSKSRTLLALVIDKDIVNAVGIKFERDGEARELAHILQGYERLILDVIIEHSNRKDIALLVHDCVVFYNKQSTEELVSFYSSTQVFIRIINFTLNPPYTMKNYFLFVEHPNVYTLGKSGDLSNLLINEQQLKEKEATYYKINRGGDITYHGPGQIVGYPILDLENFFTDIHKYLRFLEEVIIKTLAEYGIKGERSDGETGVWIDTGTPFARKICAMGIRSSRWVTMHGFALNVNTNLGYFDHIIPCGIRGKAVTSLEVELGRKIELSEVKEKILNHFKDLFEVEEFELNL